VISKEALQVINKERLFQRLMELGEIGKQPSGGVTRLALTEEDRQGLELVASYMKEAGLSVRRDAVGNLIGRKEGTNPQAPLVVTGSHTDTVIEGGMFDGALGVLGAIEALQTMHEQGMMTEHPIEVCVYRDEEGVRFNGAGLSGARGTVGGIVPERLLHADKQGITIAEALRANGLDPERIGEAARPEGSVKAHVELHIEQGKVLESLELSVGVVTGICCASRMRVTIRGEADHAGTTPMNIRRDPLVAAAEIIQAVEYEAARNGTSVGTVGQIQAFPGAVNVIPGEVRFTIDIRDISDQALGEVSDAIRLRAAEICGNRKVDLQIQVLGQGIPKPCSEVVQSSIRKALHLLDLNVYSLPSGAGHDSGAFAKFCPMGMIFIRSQNGISHNPAEWSSPEDCADGVNVLYYTLLDLAIPVHA
jgi:allantoate deiminase